MSDGVAVKTGRKYLQAYSDYIGEHNVIAPKHFLCLLLQISADLIVHVAVLHLIPGLQETVRPLDQPQRYAVE